MSYVLKSEERADNWTLLVCVCIIAAAAVFIVQTMRKADAYADCYQRGGQMIPIGDDRVCKVPEGEHGR